MIEADRPYLPAAGKHWRLPFYDLMARLIGADRLRSRFVEQATLGPADRILEIGCGTGSVLLLIKRHRPGADVVGLDPDPRALDIARRKALRASVPLRLDRGYSDALPYPDATFDRVMSAFMMHHLPRREREPTMREALRVLRPGGRIDVVDFAGHPSPRRFLAHLIHARRGRSESAGSDIVDVMRAAGFADARITETLEFRFGLATCYAASRPM